jgi:hypothetical protein
MSFLEILYSELLIELSEEQQEFVAGGVSEVYEYNNSYETETSEHSREENGEKEDQNGTEDPSDFNVNEISLLPILRPSLRFPRSPRVSGTMLL